MKLLAWDTSSKTGSLVAMEWDPELTSTSKEVRLVAEFSLNVDSTHSERLLWGIHQIIESARWQLKDVDIFGVGIGPGSFTGLRIGVTTARTLAHTFNKPLLGVSSLAALARPIALQYSQKDFGTQTLVVAVTDACKGELFALWGNASSIAKCASMPDVGTVGFWKRGVEEKVIEPEMLIQSIQKKLSKGTYTHWISIGEGRQRYEKLWEKLPRSKEIISPLPLGNCVQGRYLGLLVWESVQAGLTQESLQVHPRYLRASDAELKLKAGLLPPGPTRGLGG